MPAAAGTSDGSTTDIEEHQIVAVFSPKGGAGRTTIATNLALALRKETLLDALDKRDEKPKPASPPTTNASDPAGIDPDEIIEKLF